MYNTEHAIEAATTHTDATLNHGFTHSLAQALTGARIFPKAKRFTLLGRVKKLGREWRCESESWVMCVREARYREM